LKIGSAVTPVVLVVLAVGTASYAYFVDRGRVSDADRAVRRRDVFPSFRVESVRRVELTHGSERLVLERDADAGDAWWMTEPRRDAVEPSAVDALLREFEMATRVRDVQDGDAVGLDAPRVSGSVRVGPIEYRFALGADAIAPEGAAYMRVEGEGACVVGRSLKVQLLREANAYRDPRFVPYGASDVARIEVRSRPSGSGFVLERHGLSFRLSDAAGLRASSGAVDDLFGALADARAARFLDDTAAERAGSDAGTTVVLTPRDSARPGARLVVGGPCPIDGLNEDVVVVRTEPSPMAGCVGKALADALTVNPAALIDSSPFVARADEIEELRIERVDPAGAEAPRVEVARRGGGWHERLPADRDLSGSDADSVNALVAALARAHAIEVRRAEPGAPFVARDRVTIVRTGAAVSEVVETAAPDAAGTVLGRRVDDDAELWLARAVALRFDPHPMALDGRAVWQNPFDPGSVVAIDDSCARATQHLELQDGTWRARGFDVDGRAASELAESFARARADAWVSEKDDSAFGFEREGSCAVMLTLEPIGDGGSPRRVGMIFGKAGEESDSYARTLDGAEVFLAPAALRDVASRPAVDRSRFRIDVTRVTQLVLIRNGAKLVLSLAGTGDRMARTGDEDAGADDKLEGALAALSADDAVHTGPAVREEGMDHPTLEIEATRRNEAGAPIETRIAIGALGAPMHAGTADAYFARVAGVDATFAVAKPLVDAILDAW
jgi:hypothetical protein